MTSIVDIADAVTARINDSGILPPGISAVRTWRPIYELAELDTLHVTVVPSHVEIAEHTRTARRHAAHILIGVQQRISLNEISSIDALTTLVEHIAALFRGASIGLNGVVCSSVTYRPFTLPQHLDRYQAFGAGIELTMEVS